MARLEEDALDPQTVGEARDAIERSRERISSTLDRIEDRIVEKKHELQEKVDVFRPVKDQVRQRPLTAVAVAVGVGALLGSLGRHDDRESERAARGRLDRHDRKRRREWRDERRERLRARLPEEEPAMQRARHAGRMDNLKAQLMGAVTTAITAAITSRVREFARGRPDARSAQQPTM